jgi:fumarate reductase subunit C
MMVGKNSGPYVRSMQKWWMRDPFFKAYMVREVTAVFVAAYALVLLVGLICLGQGEAAWNGWLSALRSPASLLFHAITFVAFVYHTWSWFRIMPKTMPPIFVGTKRLPAAAITGAGLAAALVACAAMIVFVRVMQ